MLLNRWIAIMTVALMAGCAAGPVASTGSADDAQAVTAAAEKLRLAMIDPTRDALNALRNAVGLNIVLTCPPCVPG